MTRCLMCTNGHCDDPAFDDAPVENEPGFIEHTDRIQNEASDNL